MPEHHAESEQGAEALADLLFGTTKALEVICRQLIDAKILNAESLMSLAVSSCRAFLRRSSRSGPGFSWDALSSRRAFCSASRS